MAMNNVDVKDAIKKTVTEASKKMTEKIILQSYVAKDC